MCGDAQPSGIRCRRTPAIKRRSQVLSLPALHCLLQRAAEAGLLPLPLPPGREAIRQRPVVPVPDCLRLRKQKSVPAV